MVRSVKRLEGAGEWHIFKSLLPELKDKKVLDLGCGFGWHCRYVREEQASSVIGIDISAKMLEQASRLTDDSKISYMQMPIEDIDFPSAQFDVVISSLAFHYIESFEAICKKVYDTLKLGGSFIFSVEHQSLLLEMNRIGNMTKQEIVYIGQSTITSQKVYEKHHS